MSDACPLCHGRGWRWRDSRWLPCRAPGCTAASRPAPEPVTSETIVPAAEWPQHVASLTGHALVPVTPDGLLILDAAARVYAGPSRSGGAWHLIQPDGTGSLACTCPAGTFGRACWRLEQARGFEAGTSLHRERDPGIHPATAHAGDANAGAAQRPSADLTRAVAGSHLTRTTHP